MITVIKLVLFADTISNLSSLRGRTSNRYKNYSTKLILIVFITVFYPATDERVSKFRENH